MLPHLSIPLLPLYPLLISSLSFSFPLCTTTTTWIYFDYLRYEVRERRLLFQCYYGVEEKGRSFSGCFRLSPPSLLTVCRRGRHTQQRFTMTSTTIYCTLLLLLIAVAIPNAAGYRCQETMNAYFQIMTSGKYDQLASIIRYVSSALLSTSSLFCKMFSIHC